MRFPTNLRRLLAGIGVMASWSLVAIAYFASRWTAGGGESVETTAVRIARTTHRVASDLEDCVVTLCVLDAAISGQGGTNPQTSSPSAATHSRTGPPMREVGAGVVIDPSGTILTTRRIVEQHPQLWARLFDGRSVPVTTLPLEPESELATVQVRDELLLPFRRIGMGVTLPEGTWLVAVSRGLDDELRTTTGTVGLAANDYEARRNRGLLFLDAGCRLAVDGTPLVDLEGKLVGISANDGRSRDSVPAAIAVTAASDWIRRQLTTPDQPTQALGFQVSIPTSEIRRANNIGNDSGAVVTALLADTPGMRSGLQVGDVILVLGNHRITGPDDVQTATRSLPKGVRRPVEIVRDGWRMTLYLEAPDPTS